MSIQALPVSTARLLASSMDIKSISSIIRELIDNALDARADRIEVTISSDTLGRIMVKDNGTGIDIDDFAALGRRAHTSKLRNFDELSTLAGKTLGFRGEALASISSLANVVIITRKAGEPIAWRMDLVHGLGGFKDKRPVSATAGTTVVVTRIHDNMPPRKQFFLKQEENRRTMASIRHLLKAYVLTRPHVRMSLKVVGDSRPVWSYSPAIPCSAKEAALQMFGQSVLTSCIEIKGKVIINSRASQLDEWLFSGFIPLPDKSKVCKASGVFVSIDQRPMSPTWSFSKKLMGTLKSQLAEHVGRTNREGALQRNLFLQLDLQCPPKSYDVNITPQKDEVLLPCEGILLEQFEQLCKHGLFKHRQDTKTIALDPESSPAGPRSIKDLHMLSPTCEIPGTTKIKEQRASADKQEIALHSDNTGDKARNLQSAALLNSQTKTKSRMRTSFQVNMARKEEYKSDGEETADAVEVEIPHSATPIKPDEPRSKQGIRQYFHPVGRDDFEIACDHTATQKNATATAMDSQLANSRPADRVPLRPLSASSLNRIRDEAEPSLEQSRPESSRMQSSTSSQSNDEVLLPQLALDAVRGGLSAPVVERTPESDRSFMLDVEENDGGLGNANSSTSYSPTVLTPPPSNSRQGHSFLSGSCPTEVSRLQDISPIRPGLRHRGVGNIDACSLALSGESNLRLRVEDEIFHGRPPRGLPTHYAPENRLRATYRRREPVSASQPVVRSWHKPPTCRIHERARNDSDSLRGSYREMLQSASELSQPARKDIRQGILSLPVGYSHASQIRLAQTSGSSVTAHDEVDHEAPSDDDRHWLFDAGKRDMRFETIRPVEQQSTAPAGLYSQPLRRQTLRHTPRKLCHRLGNSSEVRFQSLDTSSNLCCLSTTLSVEPNFVQKCLDKHAAWESYILRGTLTLSPLSVKTTEDVSVNDRMQWCVESGLAKNGIQGSVNYQCEVV
ncbi:DNA mismatch repair protein [Moelleriella libera RCEF 2490]|uniref:DNA mismatch repair protein n=1 Tax=Moelleriella libera RCEF 2490 TaxID=1081109 RepID=A0A168C0G9_9HYPO|nr:DNA mismatch repair protein [Moelleriella libera RCEF 2490]